MWQQYFCCTSALHLMKSNNGIHITELFCPIKIRLRVNVQCLFLFVCLILNVPSSLLVIKGRVFLG